MKKATNKLLKWLEDRNIYYKVKEAKTMEEADELFISCSLKNVGNSTLIVFVDDTDIDATIINFIKTPPNKRIAVLEKINVLNCQYRWIKLELVQGGVYANMSAKFDDGSLITIWDNLIMRMTSITDLCYLEIMKVL